MRSPIKKMSSILGTFILNVGAQYPQYWGQLYSTLGTFFSIGILNVYYPVQTLMLTEANIFAILHIER